MEKRSKPILKFGVLADVQYADSDDRQAWYNPAKRRYYRNSLEQVRKAFQHWESYSETPVSFILQLGDIIDALNSGEESHGAIVRTLKNFLNNPHMPTFHTVGNHELYNFNRSEMSEIFQRFLFSRPNFGMEIQHYQRTETCPLYYRFFPMPGFKFLSLDSYDISILGHDVTHPKYQEAANILYEHHGVIDLKIWDSDEHLQGENKRFQSSNGAIGHDQLEWIERELEESDKKNETVIVFGHVGLHPKSCGWDSMLWNYDKIQKIFARHSSVVAYFSGHAHNSGYAFDNGIHYVVFHGIIETHPKYDAFATISLYHDSIYIDGKGIEEVRILKIDKSVNQNIVDIPLEHVEIINLESTEPIKG